MIAMSVRSTARCLCFATTTRVSTLCAMRIRHRCGGERGGLRPGDVTDRRSDDGFGVCERTLDSPMGCLPNEYLVSLRVCDRMSSIDTDEHDACDGQDARDDHDDRIKEDASWNCWIVQSLLGESAPETQPPRLPFPDRRSTHRRAPTHVGRKRCRRPDPSQSFSGILSSPSSTAVQRGGRSQ